MQTRYNLVYREEEREMIPFCVDSGVGVLAYSPLARGLLAGGRDRTGQPRTRRTAADQATRTRVEGNDFAVLDALRSVAAERALPPVQVALAWLFGKPGVCAPIVGATKPEHLDDVLAAVDLTLRPEEERRLEAPYRPRQPFGY